jgi:hypothetical protein
VACWIIPQSSSEDGPSEAELARLQPPTLLLHRAPIGYYSDGFTIRPCPLGTYSFTSGATNAMCNGPCSPGRSAFGQLHNTSQCGNACPRGSYCPAHSIYPIACAAGRFGALESLTTPDCTGVCPIGIPCHTVLLPNGRLIDHAIS